MATPPQTSAAASGAVNVQRAWQLIRERLWILVACVVGALMVATGYLVRAPKLYQSRLVLQLELAEPMAVAGDEGASRMRAAFNASAESLRTLEQSLTSRSLLARVVRAEGLAADGGRALMGRSIGTAESRKPAQAAKDRVAASPAPLSPLEEALGAALGTMVETSIRRGTRLIDLYVTHRDPRMAQRLADAIAREHLQSSVERRASSTNENLRFLMEEEERLKLQLRKSEVAVAEYKANTPDALQLGGGTAATGSESGAGSSVSRGGIVEARLQELNNRLSTARAERMRVERELAQIDAAQEQIESLLSIPTIAAAPAVNDRRREVAQLEATVATLSERYKEKHPKMGAARAALAEAQRGLRETVLTQPGVLRNMLEQARAAEQSAEVAVREQEKAAAALNKAAIPYQELARQAETDRALYESILRQIKATDVMKSALRDFVSIVEPATLPNRPVSPRPVLAIGLSLSVGLVIGLGIIFGVDTLDRTVKTVDDAEETLALPVLGAIPEVTASAKRGKASGDEDISGAEYGLVATAREGPVAEAYRSLRASLELLGPEAERRVSLFTSALPGEGKSTTSAHYALSLAQQGHRVLLIDGDLRRPTQHNLFKGRNEVAAHNGSYGIVDCLLGSRSVIEVARPVTTGSLHLDVGSSRDAGTLSIVTGERRAPNPAELLAGNSFARVLAEAARAFDRVVVDTAPVMAVSDTLLIAPHVQTVCIVVQVAKTPRNVAQRAIALLGSAGGKPAGVVLNRLRRRSGGSYYYYSSEGYGDSVYGGAYANGQQERPTPAKSVAVPQRRV